MDCTQQDAGDDALPSGYLPTYPIGQRGSVSAPTDVESRETWSTMEIHRTQSAGAEANIMQCMSFLVCVWVCVSGMRRMRMHI